MLTAVITLSTLLAISVWLVFVHIRKVAKLQAYMEIFTRVTGLVALRVNNAHRRMKEVDRLGSFEADDETGYVFEELKKSTAELDAFIKQYITTETEESTDAKKEKK
tara:strand:- start:1851 stop:2171 length:321 start_codon:yes stop_codon:yes gene_type:complete